MPIVFLDEDRNLVKAIALKRDLFQSKLFRRQYTVRKPGGQVGAHP